MANFRQMKRFLLLTALLFPAFAFSQTKLTGKVVAASEPNGLPGVNIAIKGTNTGAITDLDGNYSLDVMPGTTLIFSFNHLFGIREDMVYI